MPYKDPGKRKEKAKGYSRKHAKKRFSTKEKKDKRNAWLRQKRRTDPKFVEQEKATYTKYRKSHPNKMMVAAARSRAKEKGIEFSINATDIVVPSVCPILGIPIFRAEGRPTDNSPSIDRIDNTKGYTKDNIWVISYRANTIKGDATLDEFRKIVAALERKTSHRLTEES